LYAEYDWYLPGPNVGYLRGPVESGHRTVDRQPLSCLGRIGFQRGTIDIECGSFTPGWYYPTIVAFEEGAGVDCELELASTQWTELSQIDLGDPKLIWYRYNESQQDIFILLNELPAQPANGTTSQGSTE